MVNRIYKFYIWGRYTGGDDDSAEVYVTAGNLNSAYHKLINHIVNFYGDFRLYTVKLMDTSTQEGTILEWFKQDETGTEETS